MPRPRLSIVASVPKRPPNRRVSKRPGLVEQVSVALHRSNRRATAIGAVLGGVVPVATYHLAHYQVSLEWGSLSELDPRAALILGGLAFSLGTVVDWGTLALSSRRKAWAFAVLIEGTMVLSSAAWLGLVCLGLLVGINAIATGVTLARGVPRE